MSAIPANIDSSVVLNLPDEEVMKAGPNLLARLRKEMPVAYLPGMKMWLLTDTSDVLKTMRDQEHFWTYLPENTTVALGKIYIQGDITQDQYLRLRRGGDAAFNPKAMHQAVQDIMIPCIDSVLDRLEESKVKKFDLFDDVVSQMNFDVMKNILSTPHTSNATMKRWFDGVNEGFENFTSDPEKLKRAHDIGAEINEAFRPIIEDKAANPDQSLISHLLSFAEGNTVEERRLFIMGHIKILLVAGAQEGAHTCINTMIGLHTSPSDLAKFKSDPEKYISLAVEETVRWMPPAAYVHRCVKKATQVHGVQLDVGSDLIVSTYAANLDPQLWGNDATEYVMERFGRDKEHRHSQMGFGVPPRFCPGAPFIRTFVPTALTRLFARFPSIRPDPEHGWRVPGSIFSNFYHMRCVID
jgi:cytochrome P450